jgi:hypothetical protein
VPAQANGSGPRRGRVVRLGDKERRRLTTGETPNG